MLIKWRKMLTFCFTFTARCRVLVLQWIRTSCGSWVSLHLKYFCSFTWQRCIYFIVTQAKSSISFHSARNDLFLFFLFFFGDRIINRTEQKKWNLKMAVVRNFLSAPRLLTDDCSNAIIRIRRAQACWCLFPFSFLVFFFIRIFSVSSLPYCLSVF